MHRILLIDDDTQLGAPLAAYFARFDMALEHCLRPSDGLARLAQGGIDAAILDVMLPEMDGFALCRAIRKESDIPILMLTARGEVMDRVVGLELGADDYIIKPFDFSELMARIRALLRRVSGATEELFEYVDVQVNLKARDAKRKGVLVSLSAKEWALLDILLLRQNMVFSRKQLEDRMYGWSAEVSSNAVEVHIHHLRRKLRADVIQTVRGVGYVFARQQD